jgi:glycosyltransferase involved in cell wall biosynthesis
MAFRLLVVGTGTAGGIGRFERLLMASLTELARRNVLETESIWRREHPIYLDMSSRGQPPVRSSVGEVRKLVVGTQFLQAVTRRRPDLIVFTHVNLAQLSFVARAVGIPYAVWTHGGEVWSSLPPSRANALREASAILSVSEYTAQQVLERHNVREGRIQVVPLALEPQWFAPPKESLHDGSTGLDQRDGPCLLSVSRLDRTAGYKGIDSVIRSLPEVLMQHPTATYRIVGDGDDRERLAELAVAHGVAHSTIFCGVLSHGELASEYRHADVFVLPSRREGFGLAFLEAMSYGKPVVALRAGAAPEVVADGRTGILVDDCGELAAAISFLLLNPERAHQLGHAGCERAVGEFSFEAFTARVQDALIAARKKRRTRRHRLDPPS